MVADHSGPHRSATRASSDVDLPELDPPSSLQAGIRVMSQEKDEAHSSEESGQVTRFDVFSLS
jgi:hypothetical protein